MELARRGQPRWAFFWGCAMPYYYCSLPNEKKPGRVPCVITDDDVVRDAFIQKWDVPGRGVYWCPNPLKPGATTRSLENLERIDFLYADNDYRHVVEPADLVIARVAGLPLEATTVNNSGRGLHSFYRLREPIDASDTVMLERARAAQRALAAALSADPAPAHPAALMRYPGSHNSKCDPPVQVAPLWGSNQPVDLTDIEELISLLPSEGMFERKINGQAGTHTYTAPRQRQGPVNVEERLADIQHEGPGDSGVHLTELSVTASLLRTGMSVQAAVLTVLEEMQRSMANDHRVAMWDWAAEKLLIERKCYSFVQKHPELSYALPDDLREPFERWLRNGDRPALIYSKGRIGWHVRPRSLGRPPGTKNKANFEHTVEPEDTPETEPRRYRFKLVSFDDLRPGPEPLYLIDELIPIAGLVDVWGKAKCFKSFWVLDAMLHVVMGWEYRDRCVHQGTVVYCAFEGAHGYKKRIEALRRHYGLGRGRATQGHAWASQFDCRTPAADQRY